MIIEWFIVCMTNINTDKNMQIFMILQGGDSDANAAVAGALLGCKVGCTGIPPSWVEELQHRGWLDDLINRYVKWC